MSPHVNHVPHVCTTHLQPVILVGMRIVAVQGLRIADCSREDTITTFCNIQKVETLHWNTELRLLLLQASIRMHDSPTPLSFSCVSRMVLPSGFLRQLCPSRRKKRQMRLSKRKSCPPVRQGAGQRVRR
jgi:hypothetical protein